MPRKRKTPQPSQFDVRLDDRGALDDVVVVDGQMTFRLERQAGGMWWLAVRVDGRLLDVWLSSKRRINAEWTDLPLPVSATVDQRRM